MGYKLLGFAVWKGAKWYLRRRYGRLVSRETLAGVVVATSVVGLAARGLAREAAARRAT